MPPRRHGKRWAERRAPARPQRPADPGHLRARDGRARPRTEARRGRRDHAGAQRLASRASGLDRIVGMMTATGLYDTLPSNRCRGATMGPPACSAQSPPVPFRRRRRDGLQGLSASWGDWRGQKAFLIRKRSQVRVLDRPSAGIQEFPASAQRSGSWLRVGRRRLGAPMGPYGATGGTGGKSAHGFALLSGRRRLREQACPIPSPEVGSCSVASNRKRRARPMACS